MGGCESVAAGLVTETTAVAGVFPIRRKVCLGLRLKSGLAINPAMLSSLE